MKEIRGKSTGPRKIASQKAGSQADRREGRIKGKEGSAHTQTLRKRNTLKFTHTYT